MVAVKGDGKSSPSAEAATPDAPHIRLGLAEWSKIGGLLLAGALSFAGWLWGLSSTVAVHDGDIVAIKEAAKERATADAELRRDVATLLRRVDVLLDRAERADRRPPGGPASEPPPAAPVPTPEELRREVEQLLRRLDQRERGAERPEPAEAPEPKP